ncbi:hypothetical protein BCON_0006g00370 [Botryotinia convoluta]|uniref:Uncharacterized protein n=1 Tax=Botryotinia convoluta TaxID=54673 RepID=A0A4Z1ITE1_9HELO|nr:hypothetical protein BCON_0006g00370 [Botryotinia convoluta]
MNVVVIARTNLGYLQLASIQNRDGLTHDVLFNLCANIIKIYAPSANRIQIQHELGSATLIGSRDALTSNHRCETMFPFIQTCLAVGFTFIPSIGYEAANDTISMKEFDPELDKSQPYLVFDIIDLKNVGYCFFHVGSFRWDSLDQMYAPRMTLLSASVFFAEGHHASKTGRIMTPYQNYGYLDKFRVIDAHILGDTWPHGIWMVPVGDTYDLLSNHPQVNQNQSVTGAPSLQILAETKLFNELHLQTPANFRRLLDRASVMPSFFSTKPMSSMNRGNVTVLSLCGNNLINPAALEIILVALPNLKRFYLLDTSGIPLWRKMETLQGTKISDFHDSELYSMAFKPATGSLGYNHIEPPHFLVSQVIYVVSSDEKISGLSSRNTTNSRPYKEGVYALSLREINLTHPFIINGFANFLRVLSNPDTNRKHVAHGTPNNLFEFNFTRGEKDGDESVVYQPYKPYPGAVKHVFRHRYAFIKAKAHSAHAEADSSQKYIGCVGFVKSFEPQLVVADIHQFLQQVTGEEDDMIIKQARDFWKRGTGLLDLQKCSEAEVKGIAKEAKLLFGIRDDNGRMMLRVFGQETS